MYPHMSMLEIKRATLADYEVLNKAWRLNQVNNQFLESYNAWQSTLAKSTDKKGKPVYKSFTDLFDYEKAVKAIEDKKVKDNDIDIYMRLKEINR